MLAEPTSAFWLGLWHEDGNANRNGEVLGEKMSTALGRVPGSSPPGLARCSVGHCWAGSPLPHTAGGSPFAPGSPLALHTCLCSRARAGLPPGVAGESRAPSIITEPRGGREMGRKQGGCWLHPRFGRGEQALLCFYMPWENWGFFSILALIYNWRWGEGW